MDLLSNRTEELRTRPPGRLVSRGVRSLILSNGDAQGAIEVAEANRWADAVSLKASVSALTIAGESSLAGPVGAALLDLIRPYTVFDRLQGFARVPPATVGVAQTQRALAYWGDGTGGAIGVSSLAFDDDTAGLLNEFRCAAIVGFTKEAVRVTSPAIDDVIGRAVRDALVTAIDLAFLDPANSGSPEFQPPSITSSAPSFASTGSSASAIASDLKNLALSVVNNGGDLQTAAWVVHKRTAIHLASLAESSATFRDMGAAGGKLLGLPCLVTGELPLRGSPDSTNIILVDPSRIFVVDERRAAISRSDVAAIEMTNVPAGSSFSGTGANLTSFFQTDSIAVKAVRYLNWRPSSPAAACCYLHSVEY
jgi:hypothetical protein